MKKNSEHIVNKVNLEINTSRKETAFELKNRIDSFLKDRLFPKLETLFDENSSADQIRRFEIIQLELELQHVKDLDFLAEKFTEQMRAKLVETASPNNTNNDYNTKWNSLASESNKISELTDLKTLNHNTNLRKTFIYFLETGQLPWYSAPELLEEFAQPVHFNEALNDRAFVEQLKSMFLSQPESLTRFIRQFSAEIIDKVISKLSGSVKPAEVIQQKSDKHELRSLVYECIIARLINLPSEFFREKWQKLTLALQEIPEQSISIEKLEIQTEEILSEIGLSNPEQTTFRQAAKLENAEQKQSSDEIYIRNAGLILAHPFLKELFKRSDCLEDLDQIRKEKQEYAVHLLHFLCTGTEQPVEHELVLEKFMCGLPLNQSVSRNVALQEKDKSECTDLLKSIVENWTALKNTSADGLRQSFLLRNGKLDLRQSPARLYIERNTIDILLEKLPWSVSVVKLPWKNDLIFVEW
jgi:hypothetical protein